MDKYLPSKKFLKFFAIVLLLILVGWLISFFFSNKSNYESKNDVKDLVADANQNNIYTRDTDGDGVYDWEEGLWGTSPTNPDTNDDGVSDGDEIKKRKEQIKKNNNLTNQSDQEKGLNQTELFAREFFATASLVNQQGGLSSEALKSFSDSFGNSVSNSKIKDPFTLTNVKLSSLSPQEYKTSLDKAYTKLLDSGLDEFVVIYKFSAGDATAKSDIDELITLYQDLSNNLLNLPAPYAIAGTHLSMINNAAKISIALSNISELNEDPLTSVIGLRQYDEYSKAFQKSLGDLANYFDSNGIIY